jgi:hypothetical protein
MASPAPPQTFHSHATFGDFLASDPELLIFRRFNLLNARALLYLQSELMSLETQLLEFDEEDVKDGCHARCEVLRDAIVARRRRFSARGGESGVDTKNPGRHIPVQ